MHMKIRSDISFIGDSVGSIVDTDATTTRIRRAAPVTTWYPAIIDQGMSQKLKMTMKLQG